MKTIRTGLGKGMGVGYYNLVPQDPMVHSLSAKGVKTKCMLMPNIKVPKVSLKASYEDEPVEVIEQGNLKAEIYTDSHPESPREWDNMGHMVAFHNRYSLGDKTNLNSDSFDGWDDLKEYLFKEEKAKIILPLYLYDHSGITMRTSAFGDRWDSGQVGFIYATAEDIKNAYGVKKITADILKKAEASLKGEVETYDQYLTGDVYGFQIKQKKPVEITKKYPDGSVTKEKTIEVEEVDSCWGFYGIDAVRDEVKSIMKSMKDKPATSNDREKQMMLKAKGKEYIKGGMSSGMPFKAFPKRQMKMGQKVEMEHTTNPAIAREIARDHLAEHKDYYTQLKIAEDKMKKGVLE